MIIQMLRQEALDRLSKDASLNIEKYSFSEEVWMEEYFKEKEVKLPLFSSEIMLADDIKLIMGNNAENDSENAIRMHEALKGKLNPVLATDRRFWIAMTHTVFYPYMRSRWEVENKLNDKGVNGTITDRYFMSRGLFRNGISRLYWIPELTYDESLEDPYEYTKFLIGNQDLVNQVDGRSFCRNRVALRACLKVLMNADPLTESQKRQYFENLVKRGGVTVLDALPFDLMETTCQKALEKVLNAKQIRDNSKVTLRALDQDTMMKIEVKKGKAYIGKTQFRSKPENLYRLTIGKEVEIGKTRYIILEIE